jgi:surface carbohydrate biosynthesis protein (TIGR04326 family)
VLSAARAYGRLFAAALRLRGIRAAFTPQGSRFDFWPLVRGTWRASLTGRPALRNCLTLATYERLLSSLPHQRTGIYLKENQPWEIALLHAWRSAGHGRIVGVPHATVRFWDLRYFYDPRSYGQSGTHTVPTPDSVAVNGPAARSAYVAGGYPASQLVDVEALRFLHIAAAPSGRRLPADRGELRVLICGDNTHESNAKMLGLVQDATRRFQRKARFVFKPHKAAPLHPAAFPSVDIEVRDGDLGQMLGDCDLVLTGSLTSAAVDAYCVGKPVASLLDGRRLNGSPLRGLAGVRHFATAAELARILDAACDADAPPAMALADEPYFWLDPALPRWRALLRPRAA